VAKFGNSDDESGRAKDEDAAYRATIATLTGLERVEHLALDDRWLFFSSTRAGGKGAYDLYVADSVSGEVLAVGVEGINTPAEELCACYRTR
jgi:hypothetical protein